MKNKKYNTSSHFTEMVGIILFIIFSFLFIHLYYKKNYSSNTLEAAVDRDIECSDAIMKLISNKITQEDFLDISSKKDMSKQRYQTLQKSLNELRTLNSTRYLYTAKKDQQGHLVYVIDV